MDFLDFWDSFSVLALTRKNVDTVPKIQSAPGPPPLPQLVQTWVGLAISGGLEVPKWCRVPANWLSIRILIEKPARSDHGLSKQFSC